VKDGVESKESAEVEVTNDLYTPGNSNTLTWKAVDGADHYLVYKRQSGMFGLAGYANEPSFEDRGVSPDMAKTPPKYKDVFDKADNYPSAVSYFQQRRVLAGTPAEPQKVWMTRSGTESDMSYSTPSRDDDRIEVRVAAREASPIRHIVPLTNLLILTGSAEWNVNTQNSDVLTNTTISISPHSYVGANNVQPVIVNASLIYGASRGGHVREMTYSWQAGGYVTGDLSLRAPHLFDGRKILDMAYGKAPYPIVWFVSSNGWLLGNTYVPEQEIGAWHRHDTDGSFESCAVVAEGDEDMLYVVVRRHINGRDVRYIERLESRSFATPADAFFVDSGLSYDGTPITTVRGLDHLEGKTVSILADGAVHPQRVVTSGTITLDNPAGKIHVGLPITADVAINHLHLTDIDVGFFDTAYRVEPPLRAQRDRDALRAGLADGTLDAICSDHTPVVEDAKRLPFGEAEPGAVGLSLLLPLSLKWGKEQGLNLVSVLDRLTRIPAGIAGIDPARKNEPAGLSVGARADLCVFDPEESWVVNEKTLWGQCTDTPWLGREVQGRVRLTAVGGRLVFTR